jgi:hypothetical protein
LSIIGGLANLPAGFLGLPSLHDIIQAIAGGFFGALADALVPGWLKHASVATIQQLVALPDPARWTHVGALQGEMTYLGAMLAPVTLAVGALRYWAMGLTGSAHPITAVTRCAGATAGLVTYRWGVEQVVAGTNTLTHGILGLPSVASGLQRIIGVLFGGALLSGSGSVFGAFLVIIGVVFAAGLFAAQVLLTVVLALLIVVGPPLIAIAAIPELSHLARAWRDALLAVALIPLGWTFLFATAGALCLDATSFTGGAGGLPGHVAAAFAGLITFVLAVKLPFVLLGELRSLFSRASLSGRAASSAASTASSDRVKSARTRLRAVGLEAVPALGASVGRAAGALGAPAGGPLGAARRSVLRTIRPEGRSPAPDRPTRGEAGGVRTGRRGARQRLREAGAILAAAPAEAMRSVRVHAARPGYPSGQRKPDTTKGSGRPAANAQTPSGGGQPANRGARPEASPPRAGGQMGRERAPRPAVGSQTRPPVPRKADAGTRPAPPPPRHPEMHAVPDTPGDLPPAAPVRDGPRDTRHTQTPERPARSTTPARKEPRAPKQRKPPRGARGSRPPQEPRA